MSRNKPWLTLVIVCKLCWAAAPLIFLLEPPVALLEIRPAAAAVASVAEPQPGGLRRLFGRRLLGQ